MSRHRLCPRIPDRSLLSELSPYPGCFAADHVDGSIEGHGGDHSGFTPEPFSINSAIWPPSTDTVTTTASSSIRTARRFRYSISREGICLIISGVLEFWPVCAAHGLGAGQRQVRFAQLVEVLHHFRHSSRDIVDVFVTAQQHELRDPYGLVIRGAFRHRTMYGRVVRAQLRRNLRRRIEQRAAVYSLVKSTVAANAFRIQR